MDAAIRTSAAAPQVNEDVISQLILTTKLMPFGVFEISMKLYATRVIPPAKRKRAKIEQQSPRRILPDNL